jgi:hypothetical protein
MYNIIRVYIYDIIFQSKTITLLFNVNKKLKYLDLTDA